MPKVLYVCSIYFYDPRLVGVSRHIAYTLSENEAITFIEKMKEKGFKNIYYEKIRLTNKIELFDYQDLDNAFYDVVYH